MDLQYPLVHIDDVEPRAQALDEGWATSEFRIPISAACGSPTVAFHSIFRPGSKHAKHIHRNCDEVTIYLSGHGVTGIDGDTADVRPGHCRVAPRGSEHFFFNESGDEARDEECLVVGFYMGAADVDATGYEFRGDVTGADLEKPRGNLNNGIMVHLDEVRPADMAAGDGWLISDFRMPIGRHVGYSSTLFRARFLPGAVHKKHRHQNCDEIYYVISGHGLAGAGDDRVEVRGGHFHYIPKGVEHWLYNLSDGVPLEVAGVYIDAGNVEETGYVYLGDVTEADIKARTG
ncbi:MAG: cupin domain-containing protein [Rhodospirillales bacterium]|jgi:mannose-6-phosphate isomerase-like protein (cupin superfamily)|nr:cupin domain-containing protein [Rhodospirillales bacterium]MDP6646229.1 cupin domain-containing protein [Rhodospirillales bacterium]MDP6841918.1 cupin domain-containing protein [Rhodospirillales bacterium]|tara:strand:- start:47 stop:913 length:867 start_codon:yes stop_codon:yes gene_type:complete